MHTHSRILFGQKKDKILPFAVSWIELKDIMLTEVSQRKINII